MKKLYLFALCLFFTTVQNSTAQGDRVESCRPSTPPSPVIGPLNISTDPRLGRATYPQRPALKNTFNWMVPNGSNAISFSVYEPNTNATWNILSPYQLSIEDINDPFYSQSGANSDFKPELGWELLKMNFGKNMDGTNRTRPLNVPYFILYNKYTSTIRVFAYLGQSTQANVNLNKLVAELSFMHFTIFPPMEFPSLDQQTSALLSNSGDVASALDEPTSILQTQTVSKALTQSTNPNLGRFAWFDFQAAYDPCTCFNPSRLVINFRGIETGSVSLTGEIEGTINVIDNGTTQIDPFNIGISTLLLAVKAKTGTLKYSDIKDYVEKVVEPNVDIDPETKQNIAVFKGFLEATDYADKMTNQDLPEADKLTYKNGLTALGKTTSKMAFGTTTSESRQTTILTATAKLTGTATFETVGAGSSISFENPGSLLSFVSPEATTPTTCDPYGNQSSEAPIYNEVLGTFALIETPEIHEKTSTEVIITGGGRAGKKEFYNLTSYKLNSVPKYTFNPATNINLARTRVYAALSIVRPHTGSTTNPAANYDLQVLNGKIIREVDEKSYVHTEYVPISDINNLLVTFYDTYVQSGGLGPIEIGPPEVALKILVDARFNERFDENGAKVYPKAVFNFTYPVKVVTNNNLDISPLTLARAKAASENITLNNIIYNRTCTIDQTNCTTDLTPIIAFKKVAVSGNITNRVSDVVKEIYAGTEIEINGESQITGEFTMETLHNIEPGPANPPVQFTNTQLTNYCKNQNNPPYRPYKANETPATRLAYVSATNTDVQTSTDKAVVKMASAGIEAIPNPTSGMVTFYYMLNADGPVRLTLTDILGKPVALVEQAIKPIGSYQTTYNTASLPEGVYLYTLETENGHQTKRLVVTI